MTKTPRVPGDLNDAGRVLWRKITRQVAADGMVLDAQELVFLHLACREADQAARIEAELAAAELTVRGSMGQPVSNSLLSDATRSRTTVAALLARLKLRVEDDMVTVVGGRGGKTTPTSARGAALARYGGA